MKAIALASILIAACTDAVPETPSYQVDVMPIFAANCVRCHGYPTIGGAPAHTRWDSFENIRVDDGADRIEYCGVGFVCGTNQMANAISMRVGAGEMPPRFPLDDHQTEMIVRWAERANAGEGRGAPRANNRPPEMTVELVEQVDQRVRLALAISDADRDVVAGELYARVGAMPPFVAPLRSGRFEIDWDISTFTNRGAVALFARLDDGAGMVEYELGTVELQ